MGARLDEVLQKVNKEQKETIFTQGLNGYDYKRIPFTSPRMNYCTYGGIPEGKITEFFGEEHGGKTTSALDIVANYQNIYPDRDVLYVDSENTLDEGWARKIGVDLDRIYLVQPQSQPAEKIFDIIIDAIQTGETGLWVLDSIGALLSKDELEKDMDEASYAGISKPLTRFGKKAEMFMKKYNTTGIAINQMRDKVGSTYGGQTTPGGNAWRHLCAVRMEFRRGSFIDEKGNTLTRSAGNPVGNIVMMSMVKNKTCKPDRRTGQYTLNYDEGINYLKDLVDCALFYNIIDQHGAWFTIIDPDTGEIIKDKLQGQASVVKLLEDDDDIQERVEQLVDLHIQA